MLLLAILLLLAFLLISDKDLNLSNYWISDSEENIGCIPLPVNKTMFRQPSFLLSVWLGTGGGGVSNESPHPPIYSENSTFPGTPEI